MCTVYMIFETASILYRHVQIKTIGLTRTSTIQINATEFENFVITTMQENSH